jgi:hypothetical protein
MAAPATIAAAGSNRRRRRSSPPELVEEAGQEPGEADDHHRHVPRVAASETEVEQADLGESGPRARPTTACAVRQVRRTSPVTSRVSETSAQSTFTATCPTRRASLRIGTSDRLSSEEHLKGGGVHDDDGGQPQQNGTGLRQLTREAEWGSSWRWDAWLASASAAPPRAQGWALHRRVPLHGEEIPQCASKAIAWPSAVTRYAADASSSLGSRVILANNARPAAPSVRVEHQPETVEYEGSDRSRPASGSRR